MRTFISEGNHGFQWFYKFFDQAIPTQSVQSHLLLQLLYPLQDLLTFLRQRLQQAPQGTLGGLRGGEAG